MNDKNNSMFRFISLSNLVSYFSLFAAFLAIHFALKQNIYLTCAMWSLSAFFDNFDGSFAGLFKRNEIGKEFGKELDSFVDCISFGIVPVICLRVLAFPHNSVLKIAFTAASFFFVLASVTRLGYFNILNRRGVKDFTGLPTTETVLLLATVLLFPLPRDYIWVVLLCLALPMLLPFRIPKPKGLFKILLFIWLLSVIGLHMFMHFLEAYAK